MDENEKKEPEMTQEPPRPEDYSRYMGTLNRIYRRNNNPQRKKLGDGITSLKKGHNPCKSDVGAKSDIICRTFSSVRIPSYFAAISLSISTAALPEPSPAFWSKAYLF